MNTKEVLAGARLDRLPSSKWHYKMFGLVGSALLMNGVLSTTGNTVVAKLLDMGWSTTELNAVFASMTSLGLFLGALIGGFIGDNLGRKRGMELVISIFGIAGIAMGLSPNMTVLIFFRTIFGFGIGAGTVICFASFTEFVPGNNRGSWSSRISFLGNWAAPVAASMSSLFLPAFPDDIGWRLCFIIGGVITVIILILIHFKLPESPRWLEGKGRYEEAERVLSQIERDVEGTKGTLPKPEAGHEEASVEQVPFSALFHGKLGKRVLLGSLVLIAMNVALYTITNWIPTIFVSQGIDITQSVFMTNLMMFGAPFGVFLSIILIDKFPRKILGIIEPIALAVLGYVYSRQTEDIAIMAIGFILITVLYMYVCFASAVYVPELWPTNAKIRGSGLCNSIGRVVTVATPYGVAWLLNNYSVTMIFIILAAIMILGALAVAVIGIETRNKTVEEIGNM